MRSHVSKCYREGNKEFDIINHTEKKVLRFFERQCAVLVSFHYIQGIFDVIQITLGRAQISTLRKKIVVIQLVICIIQ